MNTGFLRLSAALAVLGSALCACTVSREVAFNEADFSRTAGRGTGVVTGRVYAALSNDKTLTTDHEIVVVTPVTPYTTENVRRRFVKGENLRSADRRIDKYLRSATTDGDGNFTIHGVPPGEYYVESEVTWTSSYVATDDDGVESTMHVDHEKLVFARVSMKNQQTVRVSNWDQSNPVHDGFYAYGGTIVRPHHQLAN